MDYSLLLGIENLKELGSSSEMPRGLSQQRKSKIVADLSQERRATYNMMDATGMKRH